MDNQVTLNDLKKFLLAAKVDLENQQREFNEKNAIVIEAVNKADEFVKQHKDQIPKDKLIAITGENGSIYKFDPFAGVSDPDSLSEYLMRRDQYTVRLMDLDKAIALLENLETNDKPIESVEALPVMRILMLHKEYFSKLLDTELTQEEKENALRQDEVLEMFEKLITKRFTPKDKRKLKITEEE